MLPTNFPINQESPFTSKNYLIPFRFIFLKKNFFQFIKGSSLKNLMELFGTIVSIDGKQFDNLLKLLLEPVYSSDELSLSSSKQVFFFSFFSSFFKKKLNENQ